MAFHVPEKYRVTSGPLASDASHGNNGMFLWRNFTIIASDGEEWRPVIGYEKLYEVSSLGRVRAKPKKVKMANGGYRVHDLHLLSQEKMKKGYVRVSLCTCGKIDKRLVHTLVAEAFIQKKQHQTQVNHINGIKYCNVASNLEWCTRSYNFYHAIETGLRKGLNASEIKEVKRLLSKGLTNHEVALAFNRARQTICAIKYDRHRDLIPDEPSKWLGQHPWEHVSVSLPTRCPTWDEMCRIKALFWDPEDCVMQLHPPRARHVNNHNFCLHLWRPIGVEIPMPMEVLVGVL